MKRVHRRGIVALGLAALLLTLASPNAQAATLKGEFRFIVTDVRLDDGVLTYCTGSGTITFIQGTTTASVLSTDRCVVPGYEAIVYEGPAKIFTYTINANDDLYLTEPGPTPETTHCRIADSGKMFLCDSLGRGNSILMWQAVAVQK